MSHTPHPDVPSGEDDSENLELRKFGEPTEFALQGQKAHWDIRRSSRHTGCERAAKISVSFHSVQRA